jgi:hypothetical protein
MVLEKGDEVRKKPGGDTDIVRPEKQLDGAGALPAAAALVYAGRNFFGECLKSL